jgi:hypothetical protein
MAGLEAETTRHYIANDAAAWRLRQLSDGGLALLHSLSVRRAYHVDS